MEKTSFLPEDYLQNRIHRRTNLNCLTLFVIVMAGIVGAFLVTNQQRVEVLRQQLQVDEDFEQAATRLEQLKNLQDRKQRMLQKAKVTAMLLERVPRSNILAELINNMPDLVSLVDLELETKVDKTQRHKPRTSLEAAKQNARRGRTRGKKADRDEGQTPLVVPTRVIITLTGTAATDVDVADYMTSLGRSPLFEMVNLLFSEQILIDDEHVRKFKVEMLLNQDLPMSDFEPKLVKRNLRGATLSDALTGLREPDGEDSPRVVPASTAPESVNQGD